MLVSSEYVTLGHPDRLADSIASNLISKIYSIDGDNSHAAIEVFLSDDTVIFGGEAKTTLKITKKLLRDVVNETFNDCGYTESLRRFFSKKEVYLAKDTKIINKIHSQSPDIAMATTDLGKNSGFNDQGIFYSGYDSMTPTGQGVSKYLAQSFGDYLFRKTLEFKTMGPDIKVIFTIDLKNDMYTPKCIQHVTVAIPTIDSIGIEAFIKASYDNWKNNLLKDYDICNHHKDLVNILKKSRPEFTVNGTGKYVCHGYHSDASMTGRKLAVNNMSAGPIYSQNQIGGGSYIKPFHASDFLLPMVCTWLSGAIVNLGVSRYINIAMSCSIGQKKPDSICIYGDKSFNKNTELQNALVKFISNLDLSPYGMSRRWKGFNLYKANQYNFTADCHDIHLDATPWYNPNISESILAFLKIEGFSVNNAKSKEVK